MAVFDGWYVYFVGSGNSEGGSTALGATEVAAGDANGTRVVTNVDASLHIGDTFSVSQIAAVDNTGTTQDYAGGTNVSLTFAGANASDTIFLAFDSSGGPNYFILSRSPLTADAQAVDTRFGISPLNGIQALACFLTGTRLAAGRGEIAVEDLAVGDRLLTACGGMAAVRWVGRRTIDPMFTPAERGNPVRIAAGALGDDAPVRDLYVSPDHAMLVDGLLVDAKALVNGASIAQIPRMPDRFTYWHVEVEGHRLLLAEGAAVESFVDTVGRGRFDNCADYETLYPDAGPIIAMDIPRVSSARTLPRSIGDRLAVRARMLGFVEARAA